MLRDAMQEAGEWFEDFIFDSIGGTVQEFFDERREKYYDEHGYSEKEKQFFFEKYLQENANEACKMIYEAAATVDADGGHTLTIPFGVMDLNRYHGSLPWRRINWSNYDFQSPSAWCGDNDVVSYGQLLPTMMMGLCYCCAKAFEDYGFEVEVFDTGDVDYGGWSMSIQWPDESEY